jgi:beta-galactosidase GanA
VYIFWNYHEQEEGTYDFTDRGNLSLFMEEAAQQGMFVNLRIGPCACHGQTLHAHDTRTHARTHARAHVFILAHKACARTLHPSTKLSISRINSA